MTRQVSTPEQPTGVEQALAVQANPNALPVWDNPELGDVRAGDLGWAPPAEAVSNLTGRRLFLYRLMAAALLGGSGIKFGARLITDEIWPPNASSLRWLPECEAFARRELPAKTIVSVFQGTGRVHGRPYCEWIARNAYDTERPNSQTLALYTDLANDGSTPSDWALRFIEMSQYGDRMDITAISGGAASAFSGLLKLIKTGIQPPKLGNVIIINGIVDNKDFAHPAMGAALSMYSELSEGTVIDKGSLSIGNRVAQDRREFFTQLLTQPFDLLGNVVYDATHGSPPYMMGNQMRTIKHGVDLDVEGGLLAPAIDRKHTNLVYVFTEADDYVNNGASYERFARFAARHNIPITKVVMPRGTRHADVEAASKRLKPYLQIG